MVIFHNLFILTLHHGFLGYRDSSSELGSCSEMKAGAVFITLKMTVLFGTGFCFFLNDEYLSPIKGLRISKNYQTGND